MYSLSDKFFIAHVLDSNFVFLRAKASSAVASSTIGGGGGGGGGSYSYIRVLRH